MPTNLKMTRPITPASASAPRIAANRFCTEWVTGVGASAGASAGENRLVLSDGGDEVAVTSVAASATLDGCVSATGALVSLSTTLTAAPEDFAGVDPA